MQPSNKIFHNAFSNPAATGPISNPFAQNNGSQAPTAPTCRAAGTSQPQGGNEERQGGKGPMLRGPGKVEAENMSLRPAGGEGDRSGDRAQREFICEETQCNGPITVRLKEAYSLLKNGTCEQQSEFLKGQLSSPQFKSIFRQGLVYFERSQERAEEFSSKYCGPAQILFGFDFKPLLGTAAQEFQNFNLPNAEARELPNNYMANALKCPQLDNFFKEVIERFSQMTSVSELILLQYLKKYLIKNMVYPRKILTLLQNFQKGVTMRRVNYEFVRDLYLGLGSVNMAGQGNLIPQQTQEHSKPNFPEVDCLHPFYMEIFHFFIQEYYSECLSMVKIIEYLATRNEQGMPETQSQHSKAPQFSEEEEEEGNESENRASRQKNPARRGAWGLKRLGLKFNSYFRQHLLKDSVGMLWRKYKEFCEVSHRESISVEGEGNQGKKRRKIFLENTQRYCIESKLRSARNHIRKAISTATIYILEEYANGQPQALVDTMGISPEDALNFLDQDLVCVCESGSYSPHEEHLYIEGSLSLLLKVLPIKYLLVTASPTSPSSSFMNRVKRILGQAQGASSAENRGVLVREVKKMRDNVLKTKSPYLASIRFLFLLTAGEGSTAERSTNAGEGDRRSLDSPIRKLHSVSTPQGNSSHHQNFLMSSKAPEYWCKHIPKSLEWMMRGEGMEGPMETCKKTWAEWLAVFLHLYVADNTETLLEGGQELLAQTVAMCKSIIEENHDEFWLDFELDPSTGSHQEAFEGYQVAGNCWAGGSRHPHTMALIREFLQALVQANPRLSQSGVSARQQIFYLMLPVLTKCQGHSPTSSLLTFELIGCEGLPKMVRDKLERDLDFSMGGGTGMHSVGNVSLEKGGVGSRNSFRGGLSGFFRRDCDRSGQQLTPEGQNCTQDTFNSSQNNGGQKPLTYYPEQELKFIARAVHNCIEDLPELESRIFSTEPQHCTGVLLALFLLKSLKKLILSQQRPDHNNLIQEASAASSLKSIRYTISALDSMFALHRDRPPGWPGEEHSPREAFLVALSILTHEEETILGENSTYNKLHYALQEMVGLVCSRHGTAPHTEAYRQGHKLKQVLSRHLNSILKNTMSISEYFPLSMRRVEEELHYQTWAKLIGQGNFVEFKFQFSALQAKRLHYRCSPWLYTFLLILQSDELLPTDFDTLHLLVQKMCIVTSPGQTWEAKECRGPESMFGAGLPRTGGQNLHLEEELRCLAKVQEILNKGTVLPQVFDNLEPTMLYNSNNVPGLEKVLFINKKFLFYSPAFYPLNQQRCGQSKPREKEVVVLKPLHPSHVNRHKGKKDESELKTASKERDLFFQEKRDVMGVLAGSLELCAQLLNLHYFVEVQKKEGKLFEIIEGLELYKNCVNAFSDDIHHFKIGRRYHKQKSFSDSEDSVEESRSTGVNIIQAIIKSLLNFEERVHKMSKSLFSDELKRGGRASLRRNAMHYIEMPLENHYPYQDTHKKVFRTEICSALYELLLLSPQGPFGRHQEYTSINQELLEFINQANRSRIYENWLDRGREANNGWTTDGSIGTGGAVRLLAAVTLVESLDSEQVGRRGRFLYKAMTKHDCSDDLELCSFEEQREYREYLSQLVSALQHQPHPQGDEHLDECLLFRDYDSKAAVMELLILNLSLPNTCRPFISCLLQPDILPRHGQQTLFLHLKKVVRALLMDIYDIDEADSPLPGGSQPNKYRHHELLLLNKICILSYSLCKQATAYENAINNTFIMYPSTDMPAAVLRVLPRLLGSPPQSLDSSEHSRDVTYNITVIKATTEQMLVKSIAYTCFQLFKEFLVGSMCSSRYSIRTTYELALSLATKSGLLSAHGHNQSGLPSLIKPRTEEPLEELPTLQTKDLGLCTLSTLWEGPGRGITLPHVLSKMLTCSLPTYHTFGIHYGTPNVYNRYYELIRWTDDLQGSMLKVLTVGVRKSCNEMHEHLFSSLLGLFIEVIGMGESGHILGATLESHSHSPSLYQDQYLPAVTDWFKFSVTKPGPKTDYRLGSLSQENFEETDISDRVEQQFSLVKALRIELEKKHQYRHNNDLIAHLMALLLGCTNRLLLKETPNHSSYHLQFGSLLSCLLDVLLSVEAIYRGTTQGVFLHLLQTINHSYLTNHRIFTLQKITEILRFVTISYINNREDKRGRLWRQKKSDKRMEVANPLTVTLIILSDTLDCLCEDYELGMEHPLVRPMVMEVAQFCLEILEEPQDLAQIQSPPVGLEVLVIRPLFMKLCNSVIKVFCENLLCQGLDRQSLGRESAQGISLMHRTELEKVLKEVMHKYLHQVVVKGEPHHQGEVDIEGRKEKIMQLEAFTLIHEHFVAQLSERIPSGGYDRTEVKPKNRPTPGDNFESGQYVDMVFKFLRQSIGYYSGGPQGSTAHDPQSAWERTSKSRRCHFEEVFMMQANHTHLQLSLLLELKESLTLVRSLTKTKHYWANRTFGPVLESVFIGFLAADRSIMRQISEAVADPEQRRRNIMLLETLLSSPTADGSSSEFLKFLIETKLYRNGHELLKANSKDNPRGQQYTLLQFVSMLQILQCLHLYTQALGDCLEDSRTLTNFYSKVIPDLEVQDVLLLYDSLSNTLAYIMDAYSAILVDSNIDGYLSPSGDRHRGTDHHRQLGRRLAPSQSNQDSEVLESNLSLYSKIRDGVTDFAFHSHFLTPYLVNLMDFALPQPQSPKFPHTSSFLNMLIQSVESLARTGLSLVQVWSNSDWKTEESTVGRKGFLKVLKDWVGKCSGRLPGLEGIRSQIQEETDDYRNP